MWLRPLNTLITNKKATMAINTALRRGSRMYHSQAREKKSARARSAGDSGVAGSLSHIGLRCEWSRGGAALEDAIARYRVGDVLQLLSAEAVEPDG
jgi:hypothetical protein